MVSQGDDATMPDTRQGPRPSGPAAAADLGERYEVGAVLGRGGMGEVRLARDVRIDREVAVKLMRSAQHDEASLGRFFREARVQGVLEHPAVVPVHDLGIDPTGNPYFVMKRLAGTTLADLLVSADPALRARWPRRQLLARLVDVCLAIEFAHTRGVIHRDLKPANIMLGDFGEAYVLDWGLARIADEREELRLVTPLSGDDLGNAATGVGHTAVGDLLGTPGYMSPEQARGEVVDARTDVFALGCVLFEILTGAPALPRGLEGLAAAIAAPCHRPSTRAAEVPPELDDLCARATAAEAAARPTARALADGIQAYLDGDRDTARRRELAEAHARSARAALDAATDDASDAARATAMREAGRALALDPANALAQHVLGRLLLAAPRTMPAEALLAADAERGETRQKVIRWAAYGFFGLLLSVLGLLALPVRATWPVLGLAALTGLTCLALRGVSRRPMPMRDPRFLLVIGLTSAMLTGAGIILGPLLIMPIFMVGAISGFLGQHTSYSPWIIITAFVAPWLLVLGLELGGVLPPSIRFEDGELVLRAWLIDLTPRTTAMILGLSIVTQIVNTTFVALTGRRAQERAQDRVHAQRWHLQQLLPHGGDVEPAPGPDRP